MRPLMAFVPSLVLRRRITAFLTEPVRKKEEGRNFGILHSLTTDCLLSLVSNNKPHSRQHQILATCIS